MSTLRDRIQNILHILSEIPTPPAAPAALTNALDGYLKTLQAEKAKFDEIERWKDFMAELATKTESSARNTLNQLSDKEFKIFCTIHKIQMQKAKPAKTSKGKVIQKKVAAKKAKGKKPAQAEIPEKRAPDCLTPAVSAKEATTETILDTVLNLKQQGTI